MRDPDASTHSEDVGKAWATGRREPAPPRRTTRSEVLQAAQRHSRLLWSIVGAAVAFAALVTAVWPASYAATAEVVFDPRGTAGAPVSSDTIETELSIIRSREMARAVAGALGRSGANAPRPTVDELAHGLTAARIEGTYTLAISFSASDPQTAARVANIFAEQYGRGRLAGPSGGVSPLDPRNARIISRAEAPLARALPSWPLNLGIGVALGLLVGVVAALIAEARLSGLTSGSEIEERLGLHHLGSIPVVGSVLASGASPLDAVVQAPMSAFAEAFRGVLMSIRQVGGRDAQVIAITSALPNEGKTTIAACLARTIALSGETVVLLDCDSRRRDTSALFASGTPRPGLAEVLRYDAVLDEALLRDSASGAWVLPLTGPPADLSELLGGAPMDALIGDLRRRFKHVLIDTAPVLPIAGTRAIAEMASLVVLVVRWRRTAYHAVKAALQLMPSSHVRIGGVVLSQVDMHQQVKLGRGDPAFYYKQYSNYYTIRDGLF